MMMRPALRKLGLTLHLLSSVGWLGGVVVFLVLAATGMTSTDDQLVRATYLATKLVTWWVIVPFALGSLISGVAQSLGTQWGLFRHYWVVVKLLFTLFATIVLVVHTRPIDEMASEARAETRALSSTSELHPRQLLVEASGALVVLIACTILGVYKPRGLTPYGQRVRRNDP